jgi:hypothetical protein
MGIRQGVDSLKFHLGPPYPTLLCLVSGPLVSGAGGKVFYPFGHPMQYAYENERFFENNQKYDINFFFRKPNNLSIRSKNKNKQLPQIPELRHRTRLKARTGRGIQGGRRRPQAACPAGRPPRAGRP